MGTQQINCFKSTGTPTTNTSCDSNTYFALIHLSVSHSFCLSTTRGPHDPNDDFKSIIDGVKKGGKSSKS